MGNARVSEEDAVDCCFQEARVTTNLAQWFCPIFGRRFVVAQFSEGASPFRVPGVSYEVTDMCFQVRGVDQRDGCLCFGFASCVNDIVSHDAAVARNPYKYDGGDGV